MFSDSQWAGVAIAAFALALSLISAVVSYWTFRQQHSLAYQQFLDGKTQEISTWAERVLSTMSRMHYKLRDQEAAGAMGISDHEGLLAELSSLIDVGRWYFPNYDHETVGTDKPFAYRGVRQYTLDLCVYTHDLYRDSQYGRIPNAVEEIVHFRREFVSEMQLAINPRQLSKKDLQRMRARAGTTFKWLSKDGKTLNEI